MSKLMCRSKGIFALFFLQDGNPTLGNCKVTISLSTLLTVAVLNDLGYSIENCDESPGIYHENKGVLQPQIISPVTLPIPVSKNSAHLLNCIIYIYT